MLKVIASSTCDVCFVEYEYENPPHCIPCGHVSCRSCLESMIAANANSHDPNSARCAFCRTLFQQSGVRRLHVDLGAVPTEIASSDDGSETVHGEGAADEDENRALAREAEKLGVAVANSVFAKNEDKIRKTSTEGQKWIGVQKRSRPSAAFPVLTALTQLALGNMENFYACQLLEKKLLDSRANEARLMHKIQAFEEVTAREQQKIRTLELELDNARQSLTNAENSLRTTTASLSDATASLAESDMALAAVKIELASRQDVRAERDALKEELQKVKDEAKKMKKELSGVKTELKSLKAGGLETEGASGSGAGKQEEPVEGDTPGKKLGRRRSRKISHSAPKAAAAAAAAAAVAAMVADTVNDTEVFATRSGTPTKRGYMPKRSKRKVDAEQTEAEDEGKDHSHDKSGEHCRPKGHKERGRERHREKKDKDKDLEKDDDHPPESGAATTSAPNSTQPEGLEPKASGEKPHKSGKKKKRHISQERATSPERAATAPPGTEIKTQETLDALTDSISHKPSDTAASTSKNAPTPPPTTTPRRGLVQTAAEALSRPALSRDGAAMRVLRKAIGRKTASPNASHDLGSSTTTVNMTPGPADSPAGSVSSAPAVVNSSPVSEPPTMPMPESAPDSSQGPRTAAFAAYSLPNIENMAGIGISTLPHGTGFGSYPVPHSDPSRRFPDSNARPHGRSTPENDPRTPNPLPRPPRASEDNAEGGYEWPYDPWDLNRSMRGTGKARDRAYDRKQRRSSRDRRHLPGEWHGESVIPPRRYAVAEEATAFPASSRHGFDSMGTHEEPPPSYPTYEYGVLDSGLPRRSSYANLRSMK